MTNNKKQYILYLGGIFSEEIMIERRAISPAANRWQNGLLSALKKAEESVILLGHKPEPLWPKGPIYIGKHSMIDKNTEASVSYWNVPALRRWSLTYSYLNEFKKLCQKHGKPKCVVSYNLSLQNISIGLYAQHNLNIPWIPIFADIPDNRFELNGHNQALHEAAGRIFLSWHAYENCQSLPKLHLDGGVEKIHELKITTTAPPLIIFFSGFMNKLAGVELLIQAFSKMPRSDLKLWLCGKGVIGSIIQAINADKRITYFGCVSEEKLEYLSKQSFVMVNPRDPNRNGNNENFPSKVLEYLTYCKPVVSTWTGGLSPEYKDVLEITKSATPDDIAASIENVLNWDQAKLIACGQKAVAFLTAKKMWNIQSRRFINFINNISLSRNG